MAFRHGKPLHLQVAERLRRDFLTGGAAGTRLPADGALASHLGVSVRTVREALLLLANEGRVERRQGSGTYLCAPAARPVAVFSELNLLHPRTPRFFGLTLDLLRQRLAEQGQETRLYTGRSEAGDEPGAFTCPELVADAGAGRLAGIVAMTSTLEEPRLRALQAAGMPMVTVTAASPLTTVFSPAHIPTLALPYLASMGRRRVGMIGWEPPAQPGEQGRLMRSFRQALTAHGLAFHPAWCRVELSFAWGGASWEELREIWFASEEKPDALLVADENYLPGIVMAMLQLGLRVPQDVLLVSHRARYTDWQLPVPVAWIEQDAAAFAAHLADETLASLRGQQPPPVPLDVQPYRLLPLARAPRAPHPRSPSVIYTEN